MSNAANGSKATKTSTAVFMIAFHFGHRAVDVNGHTNREHRPLIHVEGKVLCPSWPRPLVQPSAMLAPTINVNPATNATA